jgi:hypothetical protein
MNEVMHKFMSFSVKFVEKPSAMQSLFSFFLLRLDRFKCMSPAQAIIHWLDVAGRLSVINSTPNK